MPTYTPEQIQAAVARYQPFPLSNAEGTWAAPNTAPMPMVDEPVEPTALSPEAAGQPDWMAIARSYAPAGSAPTQETGSPDGLPTVEVPPVTAPETPREALDAYARASADQARAVRQRGEQAAQALEAESQLAGEQSAELDERDREFAEQRRLIDGHSQDLFAKAQKLNDQASNMRVVDRRTTEQVVTGAVSLALAAIGDGFNRMGGNTNTNAIGMIQSNLDRQLERDFQLQREAIDDKRRSAAAAFSEYGMARQMGLDAKDTEEFTRALIMQKQARAAVSLGKRNQASEARSLSEQAGAEREAAAAEKMSEILDRTARTRAYQDMARAQSRNAGGGGGGQYSTAQILTMGDSGQPMNAKLRAEYVRLANLRETQSRNDRSEDDATMKAATDPVRAAAEVGARLSADLEVVDPKVAPLHSKDPGKLQGQIDSTRRMLDAIDQLLAIRDAHPVAFRTPFTDANASAKSFGTTAQLEAKNVYELGALSGPDMGLIENISGDPTDWGSATDAKLRALRASTVKGVNDKLRARGFAPIDLEPAPPPAPPRGSAAGQVERVRAATQAAPAQSSSTGQVQRATSAADLD